MNGAVMNTSAKKVSDFPFGILPQYRLDDLALSRKLNVLYALIEDGTDVFAAATAPLAKILKSEVVAELVHVEALSLDEVVVSLPERFLLSLVRMDPHTKRAFFVFDASLASFLSQSALSGGRGVASTSDVAALNPLTSLGEAVIEYVLVSALEKISSALGQKTFSLSFENIIRDPKKLFGLYSNNDRFAVFSIKLAVPGRDFYVKLALPLSLAQQLAEEERTDDFFRSRLAGFSDFRADFQLEAGHVELTPSDIQNMRPGDIILLDVALTELDAEKKPSGQALLRPVGMDQDLGFVMDLDVAADCIHAKVNSVL